MICRKKLITVMLTIMKVRLNKKQEKLTVDNYVETVKNSRVFKSFKTFHKVFNTCEPGIFLEGMGVTEEKNNELWFRRFKDYR